MFTQAWSGIGLADGLAADWIVKLGLWWAVGRDRFDRTAGFTWQDGWPGAWWLGFRRRWILRWIFRDRGPERQGLGVATGYLAQPPRRGSRRVPGWQAIATHASPGSLLVYGIVWSADGGPLYTTSNRLDQPGVRKGGARRNRPMVFGTAGSGHFLWSAHGYRAREEKSWLSPQNV